MIMAFCLASDPGGIGRLWRLAILRRTGLGGYADSTSVPAREGYARRSNASIPGLKGIAATATSAWTSILSQK